MSTEEFSGRLSCREFRKLQVGYHIDIDISSQNTAANKAKELEKWARRTDWNFLSQECRSAKDLYELHYGKLPHDKPSDNPKQQSDD